MQQKEYIGALSAWGGVLLIVLGFKFNILGTALNVDWCNPYEPATLAIALLFGFSERLFDGIATQIDEKIAKTQPRVAPCTTPECLYTSNTNSLDINIWWIKNPCCTADLGR